MLSLVPAIDLLRGQCVRLFQGQYDQETVYEKDPVAVALRWQEYEAQRVHVVDLDAARGGSEGYADNRETIARICSALDIPVQVGGGVRTIDDVRAVLGLGAQRVILGTSAVRDPDLVAQAVKEFGGDRVVVGIDAKDGEVRVQGWTEGSGLGAVEFAQQMEDLGIQRIIYTDIGRDGTMEGPNLDAYRTLGSSLRFVRITASGGVGSQDDLDALWRLYAVRVDSVIVGRALYEGKIDPHVIQRFRSHTH